MKRLSAAYLGQGKPDGVTAFDYDRSEPCGIVHLGTGAFHRAHQATYFDRLMAEGETGLMIQGASLRSATVASQLNPQDGLYTVLEREGEQQQHAHIVRSVKSVLVAPQDPQALIAAMCAPQVWLITLTVTEKGYRPALATGGLDMDDESVRHDLAHRDAPVTALGFITAALARRFRSGAGPLTILSCDNMPDNGHCVRRGVLALARELDGDLAQWIEQNCAFPSSMIDRIVPATTPSDIEQLQATFGYHDEAMVKTEPFTQWVVEDCFAGPRPPLERVGVQMTTNVAAWEKAKLRLLNGSHSALAYLGNLAGCEFVHEAISAPGFERFVTALWAEAEVTLDPVEGFDAARYRAELKARFENPALGHRTYQIAMDGSQKLPQRLLATIVARKAKGLESPALTLAVAAWMRWQYAVTENGVPFKVQDPLAGETQALVAAAGQDPARVVDALLQLESVFSAELRDDARFASMLSQDLQRLVADGAGRVVANFSLAGAG